MKEFIQTILFLIGAIFIISAFILMFIFIAPFLILCSIPLGIIALIGVIIEVFTENRK
jgi:hypothetical protein